MSARAITTIRNPAPQYQVTLPTVPIRTVEGTIEVVNIAKFALALCVVLEMSRPALVASAATKPASRPTVPAQQRLAIEHFASATQALERVLATPAQVVAFGEYHQTTETTKVPSSLLRFTDELLPLVAKVATDLVVETWVADGRCGKREDRVVEEVQTTTERPRETESEIFTLLKRAQAAGVVPHILTMSCKDYRSVTAKDGGTDFVKMLTLTRERLQSEVSRWLFAPRSADGKGARMVAVYGGALHNDLYPALRDKPFAFGRALFAKSKGQYLEVDLYVPEYILGDERLTAEPWFAAFKAGIEAGDALLIRRSERSYIIVFPAVSAATRSP